MLRFLTLAAPYLLQGAGKGPIRKLIGRSLVNLLVALGCIFLMAALFVFISGRFSVLAAFLSLAVVMFSAALCLVIVSYLKRPKAVPSSLPEGVKDDVLANYIPDSLAQDPAVQKMLKEIGDHPMTAATAAITIGMLIGREYFDKD